MDGRVLSERLASCVFLWQRVDRNNRCQPKQRDIFLPPRHRHPHHTRRTSAITRKSLTYFPRRVGADKKPTYRFGSPGCGRLPRFGSKGAPSCRQYSLCCWFSTRARVSSATPILSVERFSGSGPAQINGQYRTCVGVSDVWIRERAVMFCVRYVRKGYP